jgi:hypothetical protein
MALYFSGVPATLYGLTGQCTGHCLEQCPTNGVRGVFPWTSRERAVGGCLDYEGWRAFLAETDAPCDYVSRSCRVARTSETANLAVSAAGLPSQGASPLDLLYSQPSPAPPKQRTRSRSRTSPSIRQGPSVVPGQGSTRSGP